MIERKPSPFLSEQRTIWTLLRSTSSVVRHTMQYARAGDSFQEPFSRNALDETQNRQRSSPTCTPGRHVTLPSTTASSR